jgi:predicted amidophosphoribosyltransferase
VIPGRTQLIAAGATLLDALAPLRCPICRGLLRHRRACPACGFPDPARVVRQLRVDRAGPFLVLGGGRFRGTLRRAVHAFKYGEDPAALRLIVEQTLTALPPDVVWDALVPIPAHPLRRRERGWEPVRELAGGIARRTGLPLAELLRRTRYTPMLAGRGRAERRRIVGDAFAARGAWGSLLAIDDVATSGATFDACRRVLLASGACSVDLLVAAVTPPRALDYCRPRAGVLGCPKR